MPARTPPPTFLFLPIHLSKNTMGNPIVGIGRPPPFHSIPNRLVPIRWPLGFRPASTRKRPSPERLAFWSTDKRAEVNPGAARGSDRPRVRRYICGGSQNCQQRKNAFFAFFVCGRAPHRPATFAPHGPRLLQRRATWPVRLTLIPPAGKVAPGFWHAGQGLARAGRSRGS